VTGTRALLIPVGLSLYALPMASVREVMALPTLCFLPDGPSDVLGLFNLRGEILPMFDIAALMGLDHITLWPFAAVVRTNLGPAGVGASGLPESTTLGQAIGPSESRYTDGIYTVGERFASLINVESLFAPGEDATHRAPGFALEDH
jgi:purine-binding chemotaxis protein CheW